MSDPDGCIGAATLIRMDTDETREGPSPLLGHRPPQRSGRIWKWIELGRAQASSVAKSASFSGSVVYPLLRSAVGYPFR